MKKEIALAVLGLLLFIAGYWLADQGLHAPSASEMETWEAICKDPRQVDATLDPDYVTLTTRTVKNSPPTTRFEFTYHFAAEGQEIEGTHIFDTLPTRSMFAIWYAAGHPEKYLTEEPCAKLATAKATYVPAWYIYLGLPLGMIGVFLLLRNARRLVSRLRGNA